MGGLKRTESTHPRCLSGHEDGSMQSGRAMLGDALPRRGSDWLAKAGL